MTLADARAQYHPTTSARVPPHNLQAEESLLGAMLLSRDAIAAAVEACSGDDFYKPAHGFIFEAIVTLWGSGEPTDTVTVADELRRADFLESAGGSSVLITLMANCPASTNAARYAVIVREMSILRRLIGVSGEIAEIGYGVPADVPGAVGMARDMLDDLAATTETGSIMSCRDLLSEGLERLEVLYDHGNTVAGLPTGFLDLDDRMGGLAGLTVVGARPSVGKALSLDTPLPTPAGWTTMGQVHAGDQVLDEKGVPCLVLKTTPVMVGRECFLVSFDDGSEIVADADHQWFVYDASAWKSWREARYRQSGYSANVRANPNLARDQSHKQKKPRVVSTRQMLQEGIHVGTDQRPNWYLPLAHPLDLPEVALPIDPYLLGVWLGDGTTAGGRITLNRADAPEIEARLGSCHRQPSGEMPHCVTVNVDGLYRALRTVGLLGDKQIPAIYLRASIKQRLALLQGLMDTDGSTNKGSVEITFANQMLINQTRELVLSLGYKPGPIESRTIRLGKSLFKAWRFSWRPADTHVFSLDRKAQSLKTARTDLAEGGRHTRRTISAITPCPSVPVRCISVSSPSHQYLAGRGMIPTHNTAWALTVARHAAATQGTPVLFFSLEMSRAEISQRLLCSEGRVDGMRIRNGQLLESDWPKISNALGRLGEAPLYVDDRVTTSVAEMRSRASRLRSRLGSLGLIVVDYVQLMAGREKAENRQVQLAEISRGLKILSRELEVPVLALSQLSRAVELRADKRPQLADLRETGAWEQDADAVIGLYRDELYYPESDDKGMAEVAILKNRNGPTGVVRLAWLASYTSFANMARV